MSKLFLAVSIIGDFSLPATDDMDNESASPLPAPTYILVIGTIELSSLAIFKEVSYLVLPPILLTVILLFMPFNWLITDSLIAPVPPITIILDGFNLFISSTVAFGKLLFADNNIGASSAVDNGVAVSPSTKWLLSPFTNIIVFADFQPSWDILTAVPYLSLPIKSVLTKVFDSTLTILVFVTVLLSLSVTLYAIWCFPTLKVLKFVVGNTILLVIPHLHYH